MNIKLCKTEFTVMADMEENFPRGGNRPKSQKRQKEEDNLFGIDKAPKRKKSKKERELYKDKVTEDSFHASLKIQGSLSYNKIQVGMVILGCVRHISNFSIEVELPGVIFGYVKITNISDPFVKFLNKTLKENAEETDLVLKKMFHVGQFLPVKVINLEHNEKGTQIECTTNPKDINESKHHSSFKKGMLVWACIKSELDHGYEVNVGVKNCRVFLPTKNVEENTSSNIGKPFWCTVHKSESTGTVTTLRVSSKHQHVNATTVEDIIRLDDLMPGIKVELLTEKITSTGIQGKFLNDYFGYIDEMYFNTLKKPEEYQEGILMAAYVLYVEPTTKVTYLTMWNLESVPAPSHQIGSILSAKVKSKAPSGMYLSSSKEKCFVTNKRLIKTFSKTSDFSENINQKYPTGSEHQCRILDYNHMSRMYIGTLEKSILNEKHFSVNDVQIGQLLRVIIAATKPEGLVVKTGHIRGFVPNLYISNAAYTNKIKRKFKEGLKFKARVLYIDNGNIVLTLKSDQVSSEKCLTSLKQVKRGERYPGVVIKTKDEGVKVVFYNNVKGWIGKNYLTENKNSDDIDPTQYFYRGQVVNPWVTGVKGENVILTLRQPAKLKSVENLRICQKIKGFVGKIYEDKIDIKTKKGKYVGIVPLNHLSCALSLCHPFLKTLNVGDQIDDLICINNKLQPPLLSRREALALRRCKRIKVKKFESLKPGNLIRCSYISSSKSGIKVLPLILDYTEYILIKNKDIDKKGSAIRTFEMHQSIVAKVVSVDHTLNQIDLTIKFSEVFDNRVETVMDYFSQCLSDENYVKKFGKDHDWPLCQYEPGDRILCTVNHLGNEGGCVVILPNGVLSLVAPRLCPDVTLEQNIKGVLISQNFENNYNEVCLKADICQRINSVQDGLLNTSNLSSCIAETLLIKEYYAIVVLKSKNSNRQLVYVPLYFHENDVEGSRKHYESSKFKICVCGKVGSCLIGLSKKLFLRLDKKSIRVNRETRTSTIPHSVSEENIPSENNSNPVANDRIVLPVNVRDSHHIQAINGLIIEIRDDDNDISNQNNVTNERVPLASSTTNSNHSETTNGIQTETLEDENNVNSQDDNQFEAETVEDEGDEQNAGTEEDDTSETEASSEEETKVRKVDLKRKFSSTTSSGNSSEMVAPVLSGASSFFDSSIHQHEQDSSSDEEEEEQEVVKKKKKLTPSERAELARLEEEKLLKIETELADSAKAPESVEQFDRLLVANPNSSELWMKYMALHIAATEFEKARTVAKRALEVIDMTLIKERFNIWVALLNMENMFGTMETFNQLFDDALKCNDSLEIYLRTIHMLGEAGKIGEMEDKIKKVRSKHKQDPKMWLEIAKTYYLISKYKEARNLKEASLKSIQNKKIQMEIIVKFALMEYKYGEEDQGAAIFETILSTDPKKVNIWVTYVDQLVKKNKIEQARKVLERAVSQHLPVKHMKTLFLKFRMFEEQHGTSQNVEAVKQSAKEYFLKVSKNM